VAILTLIYGLHVVDHCVFITAARLVCVWSTGAHLSMQPVKNVANSVHSGFPGRDIA